MPVNADSEPAPCGDSDNVLNPVVDDSDTEKSEEEEEIVEFGQIVIKDNETDAVELDFQHCKIPKIENLETLSKIERLGLRWNFIKKIENLGFLTTLQELELYD